MTQLVKRYPVDEKQTAKAVGSGDLSVLATPILVAMMENCAKELLAKSLAEDETSVGFTLELKHLAPSPVGSTVQVTAELLKQANKRVDFHIVAKENGQKIGESEHQRVIVKSENFMKKMQEKHQM